MHVPLFKSWPGPHYADSQWMPVWSVVTVGVENWTCIIRIVWRRPVTILVNVMRGVAHTKLATTSALNLRQNISRSHLWRQPVFNHNSKAFWCSTALSWPTVAFHKGKDLFIQNPTRLGHQLCQFTLGIWIRVLEKYYKFVKMVYMAISETFHCIRVCLFSPYLGHYRGI